MDLATLLTLLLAVLAGGVWAGRVDRSLREVCRRLTVLEETQRPRGG